MKIFCVLHFALFCLLHRYISSEQLNFPTAESLNNSNSSDICRQKRSADDEDVINRFEMERVSPLFEIVRHLPAFEDNWLSNPATIPTFPSFPSIKLENESSSYDEYKIEVIKDEEHVIGENGKQFKENAALNWYYSAESYSSVNNFTSHNKDSLKSEVSTIASTSKTDITVTETSIPKTSISRKQDDDHVISHVPSLKEGRGVFLDFNLLGSSTTPKVDATTLSKNEEVKPNITTRYFLLQSGRIVAINVTSVSNLKPTSTSGQNNKNLSLPTYFGSRIRNKNATVSSNSSKELNVPVKLTTVAGKKETTKNNQRTSYTTLFTKNNELKANTSSTIVPKNPLQKLSDHHPERTSVEDSGVAITIKPNVQYSRPQKKTFTTALESFTITPHVVYSKIKQNSVTEKSQQLKQLSVTTKSQKSTHILSSNFTPQGVRESSTLDPAQKWWSEMKAAKQERMSLFTTTMKPKIITKEIAKFETEKNGKTEIDPIYTRIFDSRKSSSKEIITPSAIEMTGNARSAKLRMTEKDALHFSTTPGPEKIIKSPNPLRSQRWSTFSQLLENNKKIDETTTRKIDADIPEPSVPLSEVKHDFVRIVTLEPLITTNPNFKPSLTTEKTNRENPGSSRRPRYRGLSHVNLQAPKRQQIETTTVPSKKEINTFSSNYQLTTHSYKKPVNYQWWNAQPTTVTPNIQSLTTPPEKKTRPTFHLRNSVSFQTIPPGSLTDRRTLTSETPNYDVVESLQPPIEDLLIISFEPTRKSIGSKIAKFSENTPQKQEKKNSVRGASNTTKRQYSLSTTKPLKKQNQNLLPTIRSTLQSLITSIPGNRESRHFRNNNKKSQNIVEKATTIAPDILTTKQPFRTYYFEPKRRRSKDSTAELKTDSLPVNGDKSLKNNAQKSSFKDRRTETTRTRGIQNNERSSSGRRAKNLQSSGRELSVVTDPPSTPRPFTQRFRSSPFIWHRPNVGTLKPVA